MSTITQETNTLSPKLRGNSTKMDTKTLVTMSMFATLAYVVTFLSDKIPFKVAGFLEFDFKDMVIVIAGFLCGPVAALMISLVVCFIQFISIGSSGLVGFAMNILATGSFATIASLIYWYRPNFKGALMGVVTGGLVMTALMLLWNYAITPSFMNVPRDVVVGMMLPVFLPFNLVKAGMNGGLILLLYPKLLDSLTKAGLVQNPEAPRDGKKAFVVSVVILTVFVALAAVISEVSA